MVENLSNITVKRIHGQIVFCAGSLAKDRLVKVSFSIPVVCFVDLAICEFNKEYIHGPNLCV